MERIGILRFQAQPSLLVGGQALEAARVTAAETSGGRRMWSKSVDASSEV